MFMSMYNIKPSLRNKSIQPNHKPKTRKHIQGGNVSGSGGFGCIFEPGLQCQDGANTKSGYVSKLMLKKYVKQEYNDIVKFAKILKKIPNYNDYFLVEGFTTCAPAKLKSTDIDNFDKKCRALTKRGLTRANINSARNLKKVAMITMPYGGVTVGTFLKTEIEHQNTYASMLQLNESLQMLLKNGILQMNRMGVYHADIKNSNVLVSEAEGRRITRLIDWGLSFYSILPAEKRVPLVLTRRPIQYNLPFSVILFNKMFGPMYSTFLKKNPNPDYITIRSFVILYVGTFIEEIGPGHIESFNKLFQKMFGDSLEGFDKNLKEDIIEYGYTYYFIFEYLSKVLFAFTKDGEFDEVSYFNEVFSKNVDVWGFVTIYVPMFEFLVKHSKQLNIMEHEILNTIKQMFILLLESSDKPIPIEHLEEMLKNLDTLFERASKTQTLLKWGSHRESTSDTFSSSSSSSSSSSLSRKTRKNSIYKSSTGSKFKSKSKSKSRSKSKSKSK